MSTRTHNYQYLRSNGRQYDSVPYLQSAELVYTTSRVVELQAVQLADGETANDAGAWAFSDDLPAGEAQFTGDQFLHQMELDLRVLPARDMLIWDGSIRFIAMMWPGPRAPAAEVFANAENLVGPNPPGYFVSPIKEEWKQYVIVDDVFRIPPNGTMKFPEWVAADDELEDHYRFKQYVPILTEPPPVPPGEPTVQEAYIDGTGAIYQVAALNQDWRPDLGITTTHSRVPTFRVYLSKFTPSVRLVYDRIDGEAPYPCNMTLFGFVMTRTPGRYISGDFEVNPANFTLFVHRQFSKGAVRYDTGA